MMSDSQEQVRNLFNLNKDEKILDDFGCFVVETLPILGRLYLTENYICFNSNIFGFTRKYVIAFNEILELSKKKQTSIEINTKNQKKFTFNGFSDFSIAYKRIKMLFNCFNDNRTNETQDSSPILLSDTENSDDSDDDINDEINNEKEIINENSDIKNKNKFNSPIKNENSSVCSQSEKKSNGSGNKENISLNFNLLENKERKLSLSSNFSENTKKFSGDNLNSDNNSEKFSDENEIKFTTLDSNNEYEICRKIINLTPKELFKKYQSDPEISGQTSYLKFYEWLEDHENVTVENWQKIENTENIEKFKRTNKFKVNLNLPMINSSIVIKTQTYWIENGTYMIKGSSKSEGIPFSDCYTVEDLVEIHPYNKTKSVFRAVGKVNFIKSTFFKGVINSQAKKSYESEIEKWLEFVNEKGGDLVEGDYVYIPKKKKKGDNYKILLNHGVEKVNSEMKKDITVKQICLEVGKEVWVKVKKSTKKSVEKFCKEMDFKSMVMFCCFMIIVLMLMKVLSQQNKEIMELKKGFDELKNVLIKISNVELNDKNEK